MGENSKIEWTDHTFNPWMGCTKVSQGCKFCYAEALMDKRLGQVQWGPDGIRKRTSAKKWAEPLAWDRNAVTAGVRARVFCASVADVFENSNELNRWRVDLWRLIDNTPNLDWLLLTKRPHNIMAMVPPHWHDGFPPNVWMGTSVEDQAAADLRIPELLKVPSIIFLSCEPLLGPIVFDPSWLYGCSDFETCCGCDEPRVEWAIIGGESGPNARPMHPDWARGIRDQCVAAGIPVLFKQWGEWAPRSGADHKLKHGFVNQDGSHESQPYPGEVTSQRGAVAIQKIGKHNAGRLLDGREWNEFPEVSHGTA
jgi:protein gp37